MFKVFFYFVKLLDLVCNICLLYVYIYIFLRYILYGNLLFVESSVRRNDGVKYIIFYLLWFILCICSDL